MRMQTFKKCIYYVKSTGICVVVVGCCWCFYQLRQTSQILRSTVPTNVLDLERTRAQYIYIDDPRFKDIFTFRKDKDLQSSVTQKQRSLSDIIMKWWKSLNRSLAYRLLHMAQFGDKTERLKALYTLNSLKYLKDWHYQYIAQKLDAKTAVILARMPDVDQRFFLPPPYYHVQHKLYDVIENVHNLLLRLNTLCNSTHPCLIQFLSKKFRDVLRDGLIFDYDLTTVGLSAAPAIIWDQEFLQACVQALCHHSCREEYSKDIVDAGGLPILMMIRKIFHDNIDVCVLLAKIMSNISLHTEYLEDIFRSGWIGTLVQWSHSADIQLSASAGRALANLDIDENEEVKYPRRIYLLHPLHKTKIATKLDVVFLHGLLGGVFVTWRQRDIDTSSARIVGLADPCMKDNECDEMNRTKCWPKDWLPKDIPSLRILGVNYDTNLSMWTPLCPIDSMKITMAERSGEYIKKLVTAGIGKRPIIWVCHSMGGLLVKRMLVDEWRNGDKHDICKNTRGIIFYSTPHRGSRVAVLKQTIEMLVWPSVEVQELREESSHLLQLHKEFLDMLNEYPMKIVSFSETKPTLVTALKLSFQFVTTNSADPGVGEFFEIPQDHLSICKPANRQSFLYQKLLSVLKCYVTPTE